MLSTLHKIEYNLISLKNYKMDNSIKQFITKELHIRHTISTQVNSINISHNISTPIRYSIPIKKNIIKQQDQKYGIYTIILSILIILVVLFSI